jgi:hypothetical protein
VRNEVTIKNGESVVNLHGKLPLGKAIVAA